jgi:ankyrin repeat protein
VEENINADEVLFSELRSFPAVEIDKILTLISELKNPNITKKGPLKHPNHTNNSMNLLHATVKTNLFKQEEVAAIVKALVEKGTQLNCEGSFSPLHYACQEWRLDIVNLFIQYGAEINAQDEQGDTPFHAALSSNHHRGTERTKEFYKLLIINGADITIKNHTGKSPDELGVVRKATKSVEENRISNLIPGMQFMPPITDSREYDLHVDAEVNRDAEKRFT